MKRLIILLITAILCAAVNAQDAPPRSFKTLDGQSFDKVTVTAVEPTGIAVMTDSGITRIPFTLLPAEMQKEYGYNPAAAAAYQKQIDENNKLNREISAKVAAETAKAQAKATPYIDKDKEAAIDKRAKELANQALATYRKNKRMEAGYARTSQEQQDNINNYSEPSFNDLVNEFKAKLKAGTVQ